MTARSWTLLVVAKAPVAGLAKTRLAAGEGGVGDVAAADLAAAALLDTLEAATDAPRRVVAMTGDIAAAERSQELREVLADWVVVPQRGEGFDEPPTPTQAPAPSCRSAWTPPSSPPGCWTTSPPA
jgi:glycosyltransferase A (GT-A) superfamily protein (DUF2064 family)